MSTLDVRVIGLVWSYEAIFEMEQPVTAIADYVEVLLIMGCDTELGEESQAAIYRRCARYKAPDRSGCEIVRQTIRYAGILTLLEYSWKVSMLQMGLVLQRILACPEF